MGHMDLWRHLEATWHKQGLDVACSADERAERPHKTTSTPIMGRKHMPELQTGRAALKSNLSFGPILGCTGMAGIYRDGRELRDGRDGQDMAGLAGIADRLHVA